MRLKYKLSTLLVVVLLIVILSFSLFEFTPQLVKVFDLKQRVDNHQIDFQNLRQELNSKKNLLETKLEGELAEEKLLKAIPYQMQSSQFLKKLKKLSAKTKLEINKYLPEDIIKKQGYFKLPILLEVSGNYEGLNDFFAELESTTRLVTVEQLRVFNEQEQLRSKLLIAIYSLAQEGDN